MNENISFNYNYKDSVIKINSPEKKNNQKIKAFGVDKDPEIWNTLIEKCVEIMNLTTQPEECTGEKYCPCKREKNART